MMTCPQIFYFRNSISDILFQTWGHTIECMKTNTTQYFLWCHVQGFSISEILFQKFYFRHEATPLSVWRQNTTQYFLWSHVHRFSISEILFQIFYFRHEATPLSVWRQILPSIFMMSCQQIFYFRNSISDILFQTWGHTIECMKTKYYPVFSMKSCPQIFHLRNSISDILFQTWGHTIECMKTNTTQYFYDVMSTDFLFQKLYFRYFISDMRSHHWVYEDKYYPVFSMMSQIFYFKNSISDILFQTWGHTIECMKTNTTQYFLWCHVHRFSISEILFQIFYFRHEATPLSVWRQILPSIFMMSCPQIFYFRNSISDILFQTWGHTIECMKTNTTQYFYDVISTDFLFQKFYFRYFISDMRPHHWVYEDKYYPVFSMMSCPQIFYFRNSISDILFQTWGHTIECMKTNTTQYFYDVISTDFLFQKFYFRYFILDMRPHHWVYEDKYYPVFSMMSCPQIFYFRNSISDILFQTWWHTIERMKIKYYPVFPMMSFPHRFDSRYFIFHMKTHHWVL